MNNILLVLLSTCLPLLSNPQLTVTIIGSNDIHGKAFPTLLYRQDTREKYNYGGLIYMSSLINILSKQNQGNTLYLDAGDQFQGGIQSSAEVSSGQIMNDFYNMVELKGSSVGNHEFDFGPNFLFPYMSGKNSKNLASNLRSEIGQINFLPNQKSSLLYEMVNGIRIGVIGLSTLQTPSSTGAFSQGLFPAYRFLQYRQFILDESKKLKGVGANAIIIVSHVGDGCSNDFTYANRTKDTVQDPCPDYDQISTIIKQLPQGTIHGIVQGHRHRMAHHYKNNIPYIGSINGGYYINAIYLKFDANKNLIDSLIEGPIPVCQRIFQNTKRCNYLNPTQLETAGNLTEWFFHGVKVEADPELRDLYNQKWLPAMQKFLEQLVQNQIELRKQDTKQSQLANLYTNLVHAAVPQADFVLINPGSFRSQWFPGIIQYEQFYNMFPFKNIIQKFQITGAQLLETLRIIQSGDKGFYHSWNIQMNVTLVNDVRGFVSARFMNGTEIDPTKTYIGAADNFLLTGGDDFRKVIGIVYTPRNVVDIGQYKVVLKQPLIDLMVIEAGTLIDPENPRLIVN